MEPLALSLQRLGAFDFCGAESLEAMLRRIRRAWLAAYGATAY
jgi:hypothetical protein